MIATTPPTTSALHPWLAAHLYEPKDSPLPSLGSLLEAVAVVESGREVFKEMAEDAVWPLWDRALDVFAEALGTLLALPANNREEARSRASLLATVPAVHEAANDGTAEWLWLDARDLKRALVVVAQDLERLSP